MSPRMRPANIIYLIDGLGPGGAERLMVPLMANLDRQEFSPRVCVFQERNGHSLMDDLKTLDVPVDLVPVPRLRALGALPRLLRYLQNGRADLVHTQLEVANIMGNLAASIARRPSVCTVHTIPSREGTRVKTRVHLGMEFFCLRHWCDTIISVSRAAQRFLVDTGRMPARRTTTIYNGIDLVRFTDELSKAAPQAVRSELGIPATAPVLITVAVLREDKGVQYMIRAMPEILAGQPDACYLVVGAGDHHPQLVEEARKQRVEHRVMFTGTRQDIPALLSASDVFVLPTMTEALPTVLSEAMAARLPIVASRVGGVPEMITEGVNGRLVEPGDPRSLATTCLQLLASPPARAEMGTRGRAVAEQKFDVRIQAHHLENLYRDLLDSHDRR